MKKNELQMCVYWFNGPRKIMIDSKNKIFKSGPTLFVRVIKVHGLNQKLQHREDLYLYFYILKNDFHDVFIYII